MGRNANNRHMNKVSGPVSKVYNGVGEWEAGDTPLFASFACGTLAGLYHKI
jgi:hypothetical protein